jgi:hypothetical protein
MKKPKDLDHANDTKNQADLKSCGVESLENGCTVLKSTQGGFVIADFEIVRRNKIHIEVNVSFERDCENANAFVIFGDHPDHKDRICVGLYSSKSELWIEDHPGEAFGLIKVRKKISSSVQGLLQGRLKVLVDLDAKLIKLTFMGTTIQSRYARHIGGLRWIGLRVHNSQATFGPVRLSQFRTHFS